MDASRGEIQGVVASLKSDDPIRFIGEATVWDEMVFPFMRSCKGAKEKPDVDFYNVGLLFPPNNEEERIIVCEEFGHALRCGSNIRPHIHFIQTTPDIPMFVLEHRWYNNGQQVPEYTVSETVGALFPYNGGTMLQVLVFPDIDGSGISCLSSIFDGKLYRRHGDGVPGDVLGKSFGIYYQKDSVGSKTEYFK